MDAKSYPFTLDQEAWLRDLETTDAPQTIGTLHRLVIDAEDEMPHPVGYCCLGRACVALGISEHIAGREIGAFDGHSAWLPDSVVARLRLRSDNGQLQTQVGHCHTLTGLNDLAEWSFKQIAAYIRENPENVFLPLEGEV